MVDAADKYKSNKSKPEESNKSPEEMNRSNDYSTLMLVGRINSGLGWLMVAGCVLTFLIGIADGNPIAAAALAFIPISLLIVASGQFISCYVSTERNGKETTILLQKILDKMETTE